MRRVFVAAALTVALLTTAAAQGTMGQTLREARLQLDIGRPAAAVELYERAIAMRAASAERLAAERAWAWLVLGNHAIRDGDYAQAEAAYGMASAVYPDFKHIFAPQWVYVTLRRVNSEMSDAIAGSGETDWESLESSLDWALRTTPDNPYASYKLAVLHDLRGRNDKARHFYGTVLDSTEPDEPLADLRRRAQRRMRGLQQSFDLRPIYPPWRESSESIQTLSRGPFIINHYNRDLAERVAAVLEYHLSQPGLGGVLSAGGPFPEICNVFIFADEKSYAESGGQEIWAGASARMLVQEDRLAGAQIHFYQTAAELTESAVPHELAHVRLLAAAPYIEGLPLWLQEGVATSQESEQKKYILARALERAHAAGDLPGFADVLGTTGYPGEGRRDVFYAQCVAAVESLVEQYGRERFWRFVEATREIDQQEALRMVYGLSPGQVDALIADWYVSRR